MAIATPDQARKPVLSVLLPERSSVSCSGCAERGRHLLDPRSGRLCPDWGTVAVIAGSGLEAEALSTALYVEGPDCGPARAEALGAAAAFLLHGGELRMSRAFQGLNPTLASGGNP